MTSISIYLIQRPLLDSMYDSNKKQIVWGNSSYFKSLAKGTYYIEVYPSSWGNNYSNGSYDLLATFSTGSVNQDTKTFEPNDTRENAYGLKSGQTVKSELSSSFDRDFYSITLNKDGYIDLSLSNTSAPARFNVYDSSKKQIVWGNSSYSRSLSKGTYYIEVYPSSWGNQHLSGKYELIARYPSDDSPNNTIVIYLNNKIGTVNGNRITLTEAPYIKSGTTLIPLRFVSEQLGADVTWNGTNRSITVKLDGTTIVLRENNRNVKVNGSSRWIDVAPEIIRGTTFVPLRFVSEQLGKDVKWNSSNKSIAIK
ncbi:copper amine oxidase N-terminal domain-containing protein [Anaerobacillus sp. MEB173]|uniref:copper amine oxidase N-terminal domain-containing protein n=1 Tax=Anaerobacillus sp. MEB173 TaxID=3383345 RepID=UPI003F919726